MQKRLVVQCRAHLEEQAVTTPHLDFMYSKMEYELEDSESITRSYVVDGQGDLQILQGETIITTFARGQWVYVNWEERGDEEIPVSTSGLQAREGDSFVVMRHHQLVSTAKLAKERAVSMVC